MDPYTYDANGNLMVWTGTGYQIVPRIAESDLAYYNGVPQSTTPSYVIPMGDGGSIEWGGATTPSFNFVNPDAAEKYGSVANMNVSDNNFRVQDATPEGFTLLLKSGDKEGTNVSYTLKDGWWVPTYSGAQGFDTNAEATADFKGIGSVLAAPLIQTGLQELTGLQGLAPSASPGTMTSYGVLDTSLALPGTTFAPFTGADALTTYGTLDTSVARPGTTFNPFSPPVNPELYGPPSDLDPNFMGPPAGLEGPAFPPVNPELYGPPSDLANDFMGPPAGLEGPAFTGLPPAIPDWLKSLATNPNMLKLGGGLIGAALGGANDSGGSTGNAPPAQQSIQQPVPTMWGSGGTSGPGLMNSWGAMGPTETERRMRKDYLPGLLGGANPWGY